MFRLSSVLPLIAALTTYVSAQGVKFTSPAPGGSIPAGSVTFTWADAGGSPTIADLSTYTIQLYTGGNEPDQNALALYSFPVGAAGQYSSGNSLTVTIPAGLAQSITNGFYLKMLSTATDGGTIQNFSGRFSIPGMTGATAAQYVTAAQAVAGTTGPAVINNVGNNAGAAPAAGGAAGAAQFGVAYHLQTGLTKYAPMQPIPGTKITKQSAAPLNPTSAFTIATTYLPAATIATTITESQTFSVSSVENTAAPQAGPTGDMAKYLARWKD